MVRPSLSAWLVSALACWHGPGLLPVPGRSAASARSPVARNASRTWPLRDQFDEALDHVYRTPAGTVRGIAAKLRAMVDDYEGDEMEFTESLALILADVERLGRAS